MNRALAHSIFLRFSVESGTFSFMLTQVRQLSMRISLMSYGRLEVAVHKTFGLIGVKSVRFLIHFVALFTPVTFIKFSPDWLSSICSSYLLGAENTKERFEIWLKNLDGVPAYRKVLLHRRLQFIFTSKGDDQFFSFLDEMLRNPEQRVFVNEWIYFNLNQYHLNNYLKRDMRRLSNLGGNRFNPQIRYLPDHTKHMGHLGFLFLYSYYYGARDSNRTVAIWPHLSPNRFYLDKLIESVPINFMLMSRESWGMPISEGQKDTIMMSRVNEFVWRFEPIVAAGSYQEFPEFDIVETSLLKPDVESHENSEKAMSSIGFDPNRWFVILHVKEDKMGYSVSGETRDASVADYLAMCRVVRDLGGQVVRMGSPGFPKLPKSFPAIDYAHSSIRSDFIDYWLWANCSAWIGNCNGASVAVVPFGKPRLVTNQWPIDPNGPSRDYVLPKLAYSEKLNRYLTFSEMAESKHGRSMNRLLLARNGFKLTDNPPDVIAESFLELINRKVPQTSHSKFGKIELELQSATKIQHNTPRMALPEIFKEFYGNLTSSE